MNSFKDAYKEAVNRLPVPDITVESVLEEARSRKIVKARIRKQFISAAAAACLFLVCGAGTVTAVNYMKSVIEVSDYGFRTSDERTALLNMQPDGGIEEYGLGAASAGADMADRAVGEQEGDSPESIEAEMIPVCEYSSLQELRAQQPDLVLAMPEFTLLGAALKEESYHVMGDSVYVRVVLEDREFYLNQHDFTDSAGHATSTVYPAGICNERSYTTGQGFTYKVIDSVRGCDEEPLSIHAAVGVNNHELIVDFTNYTEKEAFQILEGIDLTLYIK